MDLDMPQYRDAAKTRFLPPATRPCRSGRLRENEERSEPDEALVVCSFRQEFRAFCRDPLARLKPGENLNLSIHRRPDRDVALFRFSAVVNKYGCRLPLMDDCCRGNDDRLVSAHIHVD